MQSEPTIQSNSQPNLFWRGRWFGYHSFSPVNWSNSNRDLVAAVRAPTGGWLLDVGCGSGKAMVENLAWIRSGGRLTATDPDPTALQFMQRVARQKGVEANVEFACLPAQKIRELGVERFDGAYAHFSMDKIPGDATRKTAYQCVFMSLKPHARFAVAVPSKSFNRRDLAQFILRSECARRDIGPVARYLRGRTISALTLHFNKKVDANFDADIFHRYSKEELTAYFQDAGFVDISISHIDGMNAYHAIGTKPPTNKLA